VAEAVPRVKRLELQRVVAVAEVDTEGVARDEDRVVAAAGVDRALAERRLGVVDGVVAGSAVDRRLVVVREIDRVVAVAADRGVRTAVAADRVVVFR
jgi:hypothetical protein